MSGYWIWWIAAALAIGAELVTGTFYLLAVGSALAFGGVAALLGAGLALQFAVAGVLGVAFTVVAHQWRLRHATPQQDLDIIFEKFQRSSGDLTNSAEGPAWASPFQSTSSSITAAGSGRRALRAREAPSLSRSRWIRTRIPETAG